MRRLEQASPPEIPTEMRSCYLLSVDRVVVESITGILTLEQKSLTAVAVEVEAFLSRLTTL